MARQPKACQAPPHVDHAPSSHIARVARPCRASLIIDNAIPGEMIYVIKTLYRNTPEPHSKVNRQGMSARWVVRTLKGAEASGFKITLHLQT